MRRSLPPSHDIARWQVKKSQPLRGESNATETADCCATSFALPMQPEDVELVDQLHTGQKHDHSREHIDPDHLRLPRESRPTLRTRNVFDLNWLLAPCQHGQRGLDDRLVADRTARFGELVFDAAFDGLRFSTAVPGCIKLRHTGDPALGDLSRDGVSQLGDGRGPGHDQEEPDADIRKDTLQVGGSPELVDLVTPQRPDPETDGAQLRLLRAVTLGVCDIVEAELRT